MRMWWDTNGISWVEYGQDMKGILRNQSYQTMVTIDWFGWMIVTSRRFSVTGMMGLVMTPEMGILSLKEPSFRLVNYRHSARYDGDVMGYPWLINGILRDINGICMEYLWANELRWFGYGYDHRRPFPTAWFIEKRVPPFNNRWW